jgi:hypothetical protein
LASLSRFSKKVRVGVSVARPPRFLIFGGRTVALGVALALSHKVKVGGSVARPPRAPGIRSVARSVQPRLAL